MFVLVIAVSLGWLLERRHYKQELETSLWAYNYDGQLFGVLDLAVPWKANVANWEDDPTEFVNGIDLCVDERLIECIELIFRNESDLERLHDVDGLDIDVRALKSRIMEMLDCHSAQEFRDKAARTRTDTALFPDYLAPDRPEFKSFDTFLNSVFAQRESHNTGTDNN
jgi:hypothetical protein